MLYYIHQTPLSSWSVEGGSGDETTAALQLKMPATVESLCIYLILCLDTRLRTLACQGFYTSPYGYRQSTVNMLSRPFLVLLYISYVNTSLAHSLLIAYVILSSWRE